jgi:hypothetical protein
MTDVYGPISPVYIVNSSAGGVATTDGFLKFAWYPSTWKMDYRTKEFWGCSSTAAGGAAGTTGLNLYASTNLDLLQSTHITAPTGQGVIYYQVYLNTVNHTTAGGIAVQRYPVGSTAQTIIHTLSTAVTNGSPSQFELPMAPGEEFTILLTAATSTGQFSLYVDRLTV